MLDYKVDAAEEMSSEDDEDDDIDPEGTDTLELADAQTAEYNRLNNFLARNKNDIKNSKTKID